MRKVELVGGALDGTTIEVPADVTEIPLVDQSPVRRWYVERPGDPTHFDLLPLAV